MWSKQSLESQAPLLPQMLIIYATSWEKASNESEWHTFLPAVQVLEEHDDFSDEDKEGEQWCAVLEETNLAL